MGTIRDGSSRSRNSRCTGVKTWRNVPRSDGGKLIGISEVKIWHLWLKLRMKRQVGVSFWKALERPLKSEPYSAGKEEFWVCVIRGTRGLGQILLKEDACLSLLPST